MGKKSAEDRNHSPTVVNRWWVDLGNAQKVQVKRPAGPAGSQLFQVGRDFTPFSFSDSGKVQGEVVFAGYGITAPELQYDDYAALDVTGKIVLLSPTSSVNTRCERLNSSSARQ